MSDYTKLRDLISHRVTFDFDTGAKVIGYLAACKPATGTVQMVILSRAEILDANGHLLEQHEQLSLVPNLLVSFRLTEGPSA